MLGVMNVSAKTEKVHATFENPSNTNTTWTAATKTFTWSTTYYNQLRNIGLPSGDLTKYKKLVVDCTINSGEQFRVLIYKGGSNLTLYAKDGVNEFILADTLKALYPDDYNEYLLACDEICLSGNNAVAPGEAVINDVYLETYDDEGEKVYATFENPSNTNTTWTAATKTFTWSTTYYNQLRNIGLPNGDITKYKKLVVDCTINSGEQFRVLIYKGGSNLTLYAKDGVNEFILADTLKALYPDDYNEYLLACDEICLSGNNAAAPGEAVINAVYLETYPENESVEIPDIVYEADPGKPAGEFVDFTEAFPTLQPRIGLGTDGHPIVLGNGDVVVGQRTKDVIADLSAYSKLTMVTSPNLKLVLYMNHEVDAQQNAGDYSAENEGKYVFMDVQADENGIIEVDLTKFDKQDLNCICLPWDNSNKGTVWYLLLTQKAVTGPVDVTFDFLASGHAVSSANSTDGDITEAETLTEGGVTLTISTADEGKTANRYWSTQSGPQLRMYSGTMTLVAPEGKAISKAVFNIYNNKWGASNAFNGVTAESSTWEGNSTNLVLDVAANSQMNSVVVTIADANAETTTYAPAPPTYPIKLNAGEHGTLSADVMEAAEGATVTLTVTLDDGYMVDEFSITDKDNNPVDYTVNEEALTATFTMPASQVTVSMTFKEKGGSETVEGIVNAAFDPAADPLGWTPVVSEQYKDFGMGLIGTYKVRSEFDAATVDETHLATEYCAGLECRWSTNFASYVQTVNLPAGDYKLAYDVENVNGATTSAAYENRFTVTVGETVYTDAATEWMKGKSAWTAHGIVFSLAEPSAVTISLGYGTGSNNFGVNNTPALYVSHLELITADPLVEAKAAAIAAIDALAPVGEGLFFYNQDDIDGAKLAVEAATTVDEVNAVTMPTPTAPNPDATYTFQLRVEGETPLYMALAEEGITISETPTSLQFVENEEAAGQYYLVDEDGDFYVGLAGGNAWTMSTAADQKAAWTFTALTDGAYRINNLVTVGRFVGTNAADKTAGSPCYADKQTSNGNVDWIIKEEVMPEITFADGKYYLENIASEKFWGAGNDWGTRASLLKNPDYVTLTRNEDGTYKMESQVSNGGTAYFFNGDYMDNGSPVSLTIKAAKKLGKTDEGKPVYAFTIAAGDNYFGWDGTSTVLGKNLPADSENALWVIATEEEAYANLLTATADDPVDATFLITDHTFGRNHRFVDAWTNEGGAALTGGNSNKHTAEKYHGVFNVYQKLANAPVGLYKFTAQGFYRQDGSDEENLPVFYANEETATFPLKTGSENSMADACASFEAGKYAAEPVFVEVTEAGELTVGAKLETNTTLWCIWDNFELTYYGKEADKNEVMLADLIAQVEELREEAAELKTNEVVPATAVADLETALSETENIDPTKEAYNAAIATLTAAINGANTFVKAAPVLAAMKEEVESTNVYTAAAYEEYYGQWAAKFEAGTLTFDEAQALQDPSIVTGWHAAITVDNFLLSAWDTNPDFVDAPYYINTWSTEGDYDGSNFRVPFFEYWTGDDNSLAERTLTATMNDVEPGNYEVSAWVRVRAKNGYTAPAYGITMSANDGEAVPVIGDQIGDSQFYLGEFTAPATVAEDGVLKIQFNIAADNNISWLSFKNVKYIAPSNEADELVAPEGWTQLVSNGNLAGDEVSSYVSKEAPSADIVGASIVAGAGKDGSRGIVVKSADEVGKEGAQDWDTQFWIVFSEALPEGSTIHVEFDYKADKAATAGTQAHGEAGAYQHWSALGDINFTTEWQHFSKDITVDAAMAKGDNGNGSGIGMKSIAFNLAVERTAVEYNFDNFGVWCQKPAPINDWTDLIVNGTMEDTDASCFYVTEQGVGGPFVAKFTNGAGKDGSKAVVVRSADNPSQDWDTQFFVRLPYELPAGTKFKFSFDYKADVNGGADTQSHNEPSQYIHWACAGSPSFTTEWQTYTYEGTVPAECNGTEDTNGHFMKNFQTIAFNLAKNKVATEFVFDNVKFEVPADVAATLTPDPAVDPAPYPTERTFTVDVERYTGMDYTTSEAEFDVEAAKAWLGVDELTPDMLRIVNPDNTEISDYATYDGWFDGEGVATTWGSTTKICVKFFEGLADGKFSICDMNGADEVGAKYTVKWALVNGDQKAIYTINVTFVEKPVLELTFDDLNKLATKEVDVQLEAPGMYQGVTADVDVAGILSALGVTSLSDATVYAVQSDGSLDDNYKLGTTDGWRNAAGDWQGWGADAYFYVKADFARESAQLYEVGTMDYNKNTSIDSNAPAWYVVTYAFVKNDTSDAVVLTVNVKYGDTTGINGLALDLDKATIFDLQGRRVQNVQKGNLYIINGKKVLVK